MNHLTSSGIDMNNGSTMANRAQAESIARSPTDLVRACQLQDCQSVVSRRSVLAWASCLSLAIPGMSMILSGCDRDSGQSTVAGQQAKTPPAAHQGHDMGGSDDITTLDPAIIAAAPSAKLQWVDPALPPPPTDGILRQHWTSREIPVRISPEMVVAAWTFGKAIPGPMTHCRVGDTVEFTLTNDTFMPHSVDCHGAQIDPKTAFRPVAKGASVTYTFKPRRAGAFLYHCGTAPMLLHVGAGMYGALIVSPRDPLPPAKEFVLVHGEYYLGTPDSGVYPIDFAKMLALVPDLVVFNGQPDQYMREPIRVKLNDRVRFWVVNAGPTASCEFHVVGQQFDTVYLGEPPGSAIHGVQTFAVPAGGGMVFELLCDIAGEFMFVNHALGHGQKGAMGMLVVEQ